MTCATCRGAGAFFKAAVFPCEEGWDDRAAAFGIAATVLIEPEDFALAVTAEATFGERPVATALAPPPREVTRAELSFARLLWAASLSLAELRTLALAGAGSAAATSLCTAGGALNSGGDGSA